jgi:hypothetical protein
MMLSCRKRGSRALVVAGTVIVVLVAAAAVAQAQAPKGRVSITALAGGCLPALSDVNRDIRLGNDALKRYGWSPMKEINGGYTFTGDLRARVYGPFTLSFGRDQSFAQTGIDFDQVISVKPKVDFYHYRIFYNLPFKPMPKMILRVGAGLLDATTRTIPFPLHDIRLKAGAQVAVRHERRRVEGGTQWIESATFKAKGLGAHALIESELMLNQRTTLVIDVGYRQLSLNRSGDATNFLDWRRTEVETPERDLDGDGIINVYDLADYRDTEDGIPQQGYLSASFLEVPLGPDGRPIDIGNQRALVHVRDLRKIDFSGPQASVGLRFYLF